MSYLIRLGLSGKKNTYEWVREQVAFRIGIEKMVWGTDYYYWAKVARLAPR